MYLEATELEKTADCICIHFTNLLKKGSGFILKVIISLAVSFLSFFLTLLLSSFPSFLISLGRGVGKQRTCNPVFHIFLIGIESVPMVHLSNLSCHYIKWWINYSACAWFTPEKYVSLFCRTFSKHICPSCKVQRQTNKIPLAIYTLNLHRFPKIHFQF